MVFIPTFMIFMHNQDEIKQCNGIISGILNLSPNYYELTLW